MARIVGSHWSSCASFRSSGRTTALSTYAPGRVGERTTETWSPSGPRRRRHQKARRCPRLLRRRGRTPRRVSRCWYLGIRRMAEAVLKVWLRPIDLQAGDWIGVNAAFPKGSVARFHAEEGDMKKTYVEEDMRAEAARMDELEAEGALDDLRFSRLRRYAKEPSQVYAIRIPTSRLAAIRRLAELRGEQPASLTREWVLERLDEEIAELQAEDSKVRQLRSRRTKQRSTASRATKSGRERVVAKRSGGRKIAAKATRRRAASKRK